MLVTWTALELASASTHCPWAPAGAAFWQAGVAGAGVAELPAHAGRWWSSMAVWEDDDQAAAGALPAVGGDVRAAWHVVLRPVSYRGDAALSGGARPFDGLPARGKVAGAAAVITLAGLGGDMSRAGEFFERFVRLGDDVTSAPGHCAALVQAPDEGAVLTFSAWRTLRDSLIPRASPPSQPSTG